MTDQDRLGRLIAARHACIFMPTHEEDYALSVVREAAFAQGLNLWLWSVIGGVRDGLTQESQPVPETEHPAAGLYHLTQIQDRFVAVVLDLVGHLRDDRTLRVLRDLVHQFGQTGSVLVIIDHRGDLPDVLRSEATSFELSLPTEKELEIVVRDTCGPESPQSIEGISPAAVSLAIIPESARPHAAVRKLAQIIRRDALGGLTLRLERL
jgi:hypothetical protein